MAGVCEQDCPCRGARRGVHTAHALGHDEPPAEPLRARAQELVAGAVLRRLPCGHASFHRACIDKWLARKACCPICQQPPT